MKVFVKSALLGALLGIPTASIVGGLAYMAVYGRGISFGAGCALGVLFTSLAPPYLWGLLVAMGYGFMGLLIDRFKHRLSGPEAAALLGVGLGALLWIVPMAWCRLLAYVEATPEAVREQGGKPEMFLPLWIFFAVLAGAVPSGLVVGLRAWFESAPGRSSRPAETSPVAAWVWGTVAATGVGVLFLAYALLWGVGPLYTRMFDT